MPNTKSMLNTIIIGEQKLGMRGDCYFLQYNY